MQEVLSLAERRDISCFFSISFTFTRRTGINVDGYVSYIRALVLNKWTVDLIFHTRIINTVLVSIFFKWGLRYWNWTCKKKYTFFLR